MRTMREGEKKRDGVSRVCVELHKDRQNQKWGSEKKIWCRQIFWKVMKSRAC